ncbi:hypothetical protein HYV43_02355 [Candidatus Micrarchaeota archaeon]|nr:hypothetical protein [Candidatus Micrarchaeota archaeon]
MERAEVAERVAETMKNWGYRISRVDTASMGRLGNGQIHVTRGLHPQSRSPIRAIQLYFEGRHENLEDFLDALKDRLRETHPGVSMRYHEFDEFTGSDDLHHRIMMLRGRGHHDAAETLFKEHLVRRVSVLIFSRKPFRNDVFAEAKKRVGRHFRFQS